jgi:hypothetical protein
MDPSGCCNAAKSRELRKALRIVPLCGGRDRIRPRRPERNCRETPAEMLLSLRDMDPQRVLRLASLLGTHSDGSYWSRASLPASATGSSARSGSALRLWPRWRLPPRSSPAWPVN